MNARHHALGAAAVCLVASLSLPFLGAAPAAQVTAGRLAVTMARQAGLEPAASATESDALRAVRGLGFDLGSDAGVLVRERDLVRLGSAAGTTVRAARPENGVTPAVAQAFVSTVRGSLQAAAASAQGSSGEIRASCQGRESRADRRGVPASNANPNATAPPCDPTVAVKFSSGGGK